MGVTTVEPVVGKWARLALISLDLSTRGQRVGQWPFRMATDRAKVLPA